MGLSILTTGLGAVVGVVVVDEVGLEVGVAVIEMVVVLVAVGLKLWVCVMVNVGVCVVTLRSAQPMSWTSDTLSGWPVVLFTSSNFQRRAKEGAMDAEFVVMSRPLAPPVLESAGIDLLNWLATRVQSNKLSSLKLA
jgi:hypothetical protein